MYKFEKIASGEKVNLLKKAVMSPPKPKFNIPPKSQNLGGGNFEKDPFSFHETVAPSTPNNRGYEPRPIDPKLNRNVDPGLPDMWDNWWSGVGGTEENIAKQKQLNVAEQNANNIRIVDDHVKKIQQLQQRMQAGDPTARQEYQNTIANFQRQCASNPALSAYYRSQQPALKARFRQSQEQFNQARQQANMQDLSRPVYGWQAQQDSNGNWSYSKADRNDSRVVSWLSANAERERLNRALRSGTISQEQFDSQMTALNEAEEKQRMQNGGNFWDNLYSNSDNTTRKGLALLDPNQIKGPYADSLVAKQQQWRKQQAPMSNEQVLANSNVPWIADKYRKQIGQQNWNANVDAMTYQDAQKREQYRQWQAQKDRQDATKAVEHYGIKDTVTPDQWMTMNPLQRGEHINAYNRQQYDNRINDISGQIAGAQPVTTNPDIPKYMSTKDYNQYRDNMLRVHGKAWDNRGFDDAARDDYIRKSYEYRLQGMGIDPVTGKRSTGVDPGATAQATTASGPSSSSSTVSKSKEATPMPVNPSVNPLDANSFTVGEGGTMKISSVSNIIPLLFNEKSSSIVKRLLNGNDLTGR